MADTRRVIREELERAWNWRADRGVFQETDCLRVFHGPGEGTGALSRLAVEKFGAHAWVTEWDDEERLGASAPLPLAEISEYLQEKGLQSAVVLKRPEKGVPAEPQPLFGTPPDRFEAREGAARYWIRMRGTRHPGLFLDHWPLRQWLRARVKGWRVLNAFAYTGSLSVACGLGGAAHVTTLDLSNPTVRWAQENWELNGLSPALGRFVPGDVFEWLPRLKKNGERFDCVILDPPSFSRGEKGTFSTQKDLPRLHALAFDLIAQGGVVVTSINSANIAPSKFESEIAQTARGRRETFEVLSRIDLPETFPTRLGEPEERYLKGLILRRA